MSRVWRPIPAQSQAHGYCLALSWAVLFALMPVVIVKGLGIGLPFTPVVLIAYVMQCIAVFGVCVTRRISLSPGWVMAALLYGGLETGSLLARGLAGELIDVRDGVDSLSKMTGVLMFAAVAATLTSSRETLETLFLFVLGIVAAAIIYNLVVNASSFSNALSVGSGSSYKYQFASFFSNRNQFGVFLFASIFLHFLCMEWRRVRTWNVMLLAGQYLCLVLTFSRSSIGAVAILSVLMLMFMARKRPWLLAAIPVLAVVSVLGVARLLQTEAVQRLLVRPDAGLSGRDDVWNQAFMIWRESSVLFGVGTFRGVDIAKTRGMEVSEFHGFIPETLVGGGLVELILLLVICTYVVVKVARSDAPLYIRYVTLSAFVGLIFLSTFESLSFFTIGWAGTLTTTTFISVPILLVGVDWSGPTDPSNRHVQDRTMKLIPVG